MNKIICDSCKEQIKPVIESKHLTGGITIQYFRCNNCKVKELIDATDKDTRQKQIEYKKWAEQKGKALDVELDGLNKEEFNKLAMLMNEIEFNMNKLEKEIKEAKAELKERYGGEL